MIRYAKDAKMMYEGEKNKQRENELKLQLVQVNVAFLPATRQLSAADSASSTATCNAPRK